MANLDQLKNEHLADGIIDSDEVKSIKSVTYEDGRIDKNEADFLFELNDAVSGKDNAPECKDLFVDAITALVLEDEVSPNEIDSDEDDYLCNQIKGDGQVDDIKRALLVNIKANNIRGSLKQYCLYLLSS